MQKSTRHEFPKPRASSAAAAPPRPERPRATDGRPAMQARRRRVDHERDAILADMSVGRCICRRALDETSETDAAMDVAGPQRVVLGAQHGKIDYLQQL